MTAELPKLERLALVGQAFRPAAPVDDLELFAGREKQRGAVIGAISQAGRHVGLYGERGVGKTSLARVMTAIYGQIGDERFQAAMVNCYTEDTFDSVWQRIFRRLGIECEDMSPDGVRESLEQTGSPTLIVLDELDRLEDDDSLTLLADTIKTLSDHAAPSTLALVGVANSLGELLGEHESIVRNVSQIEMPRMKPDELRGILEKGCEHTKLGMELEAIDRVVALSEGLPHYTHLLGFSAAERTVQDDRDLITLKDIDAAIPEAIEGHTIQSAYTSAVRSSQPGNLYREVLLACAVAPKNDLGYFTSGQVRDPLEVIVGRRLDIPAFSKHMKEFLDINRASVLRREGKPRAYSYRFSDPMIQPFVIMSSLRDGLITNEQLSKLQNSEPTKTDSDPSVRGQLF